jgi:hypothetical protein
MTRSGAIRRVGRGMLIQLAAMLLPAMLFSACLSPVMAQTPDEPFVRIEVTTPQPVSVGQQVSVDVRVFVPNYFLSAPQFPIFDLPGAIVTLPDQGSLNLNDRIDGVTFAGIQRTYILTPQQAGALTLPPAGIRVVYAGAANQRVEAALTLPPETIEVRIPAGAEGALLASDLTIAQTLDRDPGILKAGDTLTRVVTVAARGVQAMMLPPAEFSPIAGVTLYPQQPVLQDETRERAGLVGARRSDKMIYRFDKSGDYVLPALTLDWFDPVANVRAKAIAPEIAVKVAAAAAFQNEIAPEIAEPHEAPSAGVDWFRLLAIVVALLAVGWAALFSEPRFRRWLERRCAAREETEAAYFSRVRQACHGGDQTAAYIAIGAWIRRIGTPSISGWIAQTGDVALQSCFGTFERHLFGDAAASHRPEAKSGDAKPWDGKPLFVGLARARRKWLRQQETEAQASPALPALNPDSG